MKKFLCSERRIFTVLLDIAEKYFNETALPLLQRDFPEELSTLAAGLAGRGSECFGFDDDVSRDHDYTVGFGLYLTCADERKYGFKLERFYSRLRKEFPPPGAASAGSRYGGLEHGVIIIEDYFERHLGYPGAPQDFRQWLYTPEYAFAEAVNGRVFCDCNGIWSKLRRTILEDMPEDIRIKKLAARAVAMAQSGQYNFMRCHRHGEEGAAMLALQEFVKNSISMIFLLNKRFAPYYKWAFRAMRDLPLMAEEESKLQKLLTAAVPVQERFQLIEEISLACIAQLRKQELTDIENDYLEPHAFELMNHIKSREIAALHVMEGSL